MSFLSRNLITGAALALIGASLGACAKGSTTLPNDPLQALVCDTGYILSVDRKSCIPETMIVVQGVVTDSATGLPISGINVTVAPMKTATTVQTDANGFWSVRGPTTADELLVTYSSTGYSFATQILRKLETEIWAASTATYAIAGDIVLSTNVSLAKLARQLNVAGYVYAGDTAAVGATVTLYDNNLGVEGYSTTTAAGGAFSFSNVRSANYYVRVYPFDEDGNGVTDYNFFSLYLGDISQQSQSINVSNIVVGLAPTYRAIQYTSFIGNPAPITTYNAKHTGLRVASASSSILLHFGAQVDPATVTFDLRSYDNSIATGLTGNDFSAPLGMTAAWSSGNTVLTLTPAAAFVADPATPTGYVIRIKSLIWADGVVAIAQTATSGFLEFWFDVSTGPTLLVSPHPSIYVAPKEAQAAGLDQVAGTLPDAFKCDASRCFVLAADGYPVGGFSTAGVAATGVMDSVQGFDVTWPKVTGATAYNVYVRRRSADAQQPNYAEWYLASSTVGVTPIDPAFTGNVDAKVLTTSGLTTVADWGDLNTMYGLGALGGGASVDLAVTAKDANGFESVLDPTATGALLTLADTVPAMAASWGVNDDAGNTDLGVSKIRKAVGLTFSEPLIAGNEPVIGANSGNIVSVTKTASGWDGSLMTNTSSGWGTYLSLKVRGACTVTTTDAYGYIGGVASSGNNGTSVAVADPSVIVGAGTTGTMLFFDGVGTALTHNPIAVASVSGNYLITAGFANNIPSGSFVCSPAIATGSVTSATVDNTDATIVTVGESGIFYPGEGVLLYVPTGAGYPNPLGVVAQVAEILSSTRIRLTAAQPTNYPSGVTIQPFSATEYTLRGATANLPIRQDSTAAAGSLRVDLTNGFGGAPSAYRVMVNDLCVVDLDGKLNTISDRYFGKITDIAMVVNTAAPGSTDNSDYHVTLGAVAAPMRSIPNGSIVRHGTSVVQCLGDSLAVSNAAATSDQISDTSANTGLRDYGDQFSTCTGGFLCGVFAANQAIY